mmetsp:Transcript_97930/g.219171  ORF Transcript_97930/g.219171 Transcript_97930/m.219171 type:complete len:360 (-) Transcript_97930:14-1093(-)
MAFRPSPPTWEAAAAEVTRRWRRQATEALCALLGALLSHLLQRLLFRSTCSGSVTAPHGATTASSASGRRAATVAVGSSFSTRKASAAEVPCARRRQAAKSDTLAILALALAILCKDFLGRSLGFQRLGLLCRTPCCATSARLTSLQGATAMAAKLGTGAWEASATEVAFHLGCQAAKALSIDRHHRAASLLHLRLWLIWKASTILLVATPLLFGITPAHLAVRIPSVAIEIAPTALVDTAKLAFSFTPCQGHIRVPSFAIEFILHRLGLLLRGVWHRCLRLGHLEGEVVEFHRVCACSLVVMGTRPLLVLSLAVHPEHVVVAPIADDGCHARFERSGKFLHAFVLVELHREGTIMTLL